MVNAIGSHHLPLPTRERENVIVRALLSNCSEGQAGTPMPPSTLLGRVRGGRIPKH